MKNKKDFRTFVVDGVTYKVIRPNLETLNEANKLRSKTFNESLQRGDMLRDQLESELRKRNLWNDRLEMEYQTLRKEILDLTNALRKGGIKLNDAKNIALVISEKRQQMIGMLSSRTDLDSNTCEGKADSARFNYLFSNCLVYEESGEKYFVNGLMDYLLKQDDPVAVAGATEFYYLISNTQDPTEQLIENQFLKKYKFVDDKYRLVDKEGRLINKEGKHIDEEGYYIKWLEDGTFIHVDENGNEVDEDGNVKVEFQPFLDDEGNPVIEEEDTESKPKSTRKKKTSDS